MGLWSEVVTDAFGKINVQSTFATPDPTSLSHLPSPSYKVNIAAP
jgi:hypothetical protein